MGELIDADDLALLASSFEGALTQQPGAAEADRAMYELGWADLLAMAPLQGAGAAFTVLGATGAGACLLDDVLAAALGAEPTPTTCVLMPPAHRWGAFDGEVRGLASARLAQADVVLVPVIGAHGVVVRSVEASTVLVEGADALDPSAVVRSVRVTLDGAPVVTADVDWERAVRDARVAVAHQLVSISRWMLAEARQHALDRVQFGRPIASFQVLRHKMAECLVQIEAAAAVLQHCIDDDTDPLLAAGGKSLAGKAFRTTAAHSQQILAGIGFTTDHRFHLWLKRGLVVETLFGSGRTLPAEIGARLAAGGVPRLVEM